MKYNGMHVPPLISTNRIISAFYNEIDQRKLETYTEVMQSEMMSHEFPAILGFPTEISEDDIGEQFLTGEEISKEHLGQIAWKVTDGHHRSLAAIEAGLDHFAVELDYSCITDQQELKQFDYQEK